MPRSIRIEYPGAFYHVMARGNRREAIFRDVTDRRFFLQTLGEACGMTGWRIHAWVLLSNHYHLFVETPEANLSKGMQWLQNTLTRRFNTRHRLWGRLFGDRYKAVVVEGGRGYYYETLLDYIHLNPARCGLVRPQRGQSLLDYPWSSVAQGYALPARQRPTWLAAEDGLAAFGCADTAKGRRRWVERLDRRMVEEDRALCGQVPLREQFDAQCSHLRRGWYWGSQAFAEKVLRLGQSTLTRERHRGYKASLEKKAHDAARAEELLREGLRAARLGAEQARRLPGSEARKVEIARIIWQMTTVSQSWLAKQLGMGSAANVSQQLRRRAAAAAPRAKLPSSLQAWVHSVKQ
jgi:REP element-mobilizing transposase RayT